MRLPEKKLAALAISISGTDPKKCMKCGKCSATCPSGDDMKFRPHQFISKINKGEIYALLESDAIYKCLSCFACVERCPRGVEPAKIIEAVRVIKLRESGAAHFSSDAVPSAENENLPQQAVVSAFRKYKK